ncbi:MAG: type II toxin-antitoxin system HicB family antitoxin [Desulfurococcales archaeon]|nr:type II toxin-antitoxin system HicB family antitoxin [Desulfurococcales archaeon]
MLAGFEPATTTLQNIISAKLLIIEKYGLSRFYLGSRYCNFYRNFKGHPGMRVRVVVWLEEDMYVAREVTTGVTSQGKTVEEAIKNPREALELYLEEVPEALEKLERLDRGIVGVLEVEVGRG